MNELTTDEQTHRGVFGIAESVLQLRPALEQVMGRRDQLAEECMALESRKEAAALARDRPAVQAMSQAAFDATYAETFAKWHAANEGGDALTATVAKAELERLARARWGG
jgi:hypothetical protein